MSNQRHYDTALCSEYQDNYGDDLANADLSSSHPVIPGQNALSCSHGKLTTFTPKSADAGSGHRLELDCRQLVSVGRFFITNVIRDILERQLDFTPWTSHDVLHFRGSIERMSVHVKERVIIMQSAKEEQYDMIHEDSDQSLREASILSWGIKATPHNSIFLSWSAKLLDLMIQKACCVLYQPLQKYADKTLWREFRKTYLSCQRQCISELS